MKNQFLTLPLLLCIISSHAQNLNGLCGKDLKTEINLSFRPAKPIARSEIASTLSSIHTSDGKTVSDPFSGQTFQIVNQNLFPKGLTSVNVLPHQWWNGEYGDAPSLDLHNLVTANDAVPQHKKDYPPGIVTKALYSNSIWESGTGLIDGITVNFYKPPKGYEGDFARMAFYTLCIYPRARWSGLGCNFCTDNLYPGLRRDAFRTLKAWSDNDPVDQREKKRNDLIEAIQGNRNPFIDNPSLADHIWGEMSDKPFDPDGNKDETTNLRSHYSISDNIDLKSPYITDNARWQIDGKQVTETRLKASSLGTGVHELKFTDGNRSGKLLIIIEQ